MTPISSRLQSKINDSYSERGFGILCIYYFDSRKFRQVKQKLKVTELPKPLEHDRFGQRYIYGMLDTALFKKLPQNPGRPFYRRFIAT